METEAKTFTRNALLSSFNNDSDKNNCIKRSKIEKYIHQFYEDAGRAYDAPAVVDELLKELCDL